MCTSEKSQVARDVLAYLAAHQDAQDTLEGIVEWWLVEQKIIQQTATVREALAELVAQGLVLERKGQDARTFYRLNPRRAEGISAQLEHKHAD